MKGLTIAVCVNLGFIIAAVVMVKVERHRCDVHGYSECVGPPLYSLMALGLGAILVVLLLVMGWVWLSRQGRGP